MAACQRYHTDWLHSMDDGQAPEVQAIVEVNLIGTTAVRVYQSAPLLQLRQAPGQRFSCPMRVNHISNLHERDS